MLFTSLSFFVFIIVVVGLYYPLGRLSLKASQVFILAANYFFYLYANPVFGVLLLAQTVVSYYAAILIDRRNRTKTVLTVSIILCLLSLIIFKYANFFGKVLTELLGLLGFSVTSPDWGLLLPIGVSFYTFQTVGYLIDVYRKDYRAERDFIAYSSFVSFFPVILAGPIQRGNTLIPQIKKKPVFDWSNITSGGKMFIWGAFMKLCAADRLATYVDAIFNNLPQHNGTSVLLASVLYSFQIYCDFAGYSLMAIGTSKFLGFNIPENFKRPYFATSMKEFWQRWHIALSTWFRDYVYFPLGGSRVCFFRAQVNLMITFLVSGLWHGAAYTFLIWGGLHGLLQVIEKVLIRIGLMSAKPSPNKIKHLLSVLIVFVLATIAWIYFRADSISTANLAVYKIFTSAGMPFYAPVVLLFGGLSLLIVLVHDYLDEHRKVIVFNTYFKTILYALMVIFILLFGVLDGGQFIYFAF